MNAASAPENVVPVSTCKSYSRLWLIMLGSLIAIQAWMTLGLFARDASTTFPDRRFLSDCWHRICNDEPILSGQHPLHLYFGQLGAEAFRERGSLCSFDPSFHAGFPKTPVFDSGSRPAELFLFLAGGTYRPAAYKLGLFICCCLIPIVVAVSAYSIRLSHGAAALAAALGVVISGSTPCREQLREGNLDMLLASLCSLAFVALLVRYHRTPCLGCWLAMTVTAALTWFAQPFLCLVLAPLVLIYYFSVGVKHSLGWHTALLVALVGAVGVNGFWLIDWARSWWIRLPLQVHTATLKHRTLHTLWNASLWGEFQDRVFGIGLLCIAAIGVILMNARRERTPARLFGMAAGGCWALAMGGIVWYPMGCIGTSVLLVPSWFFATIPAVFLFDLLGRRLCECVGAGWRSAVVQLGVFGATGLAVFHLMTSWSTGLMDDTRLTVGLGPEREKLIATLQAHTTPAARILWEDRTSHRECMRWSALLPVLTERDFIGGLTPDACIEHAQTGITDQMLAGRPLAEWSDAELDDFCRRYNIGWVVCWSPGAIARFRTWKGEGAATPVHDDGPGCLFAVQPRSFVLKGQARWLAADRKHVALADVVPEDGKVVLSLHYHSSLRASPLRVQVERETDPYDPIPFVRLRVPGPTALVTLTWDDR